MSGEAAAQDFLDSLRRIKQRLQEQGAEGPHIVSVILDGENAWEYYDNDGKAFFEALYTKLNEADDIKMATPTDYLSLFPEQRELENLHAGAWFSSDYGTWIGEAEETTAWNYLSRVRAFLADYDLYKRKQPPSPAALQKALDAMYAAEGSDWFWWYGADQTGEDAYFDVAFRSLLSDVYRALEQPVPSFLQVPIVAAKAADAERPASGLITPVIDGQADDDAWAAAGVYSAAGGAQARSDDIVTSLSYGFDKQNLYLRLDGREPWQTLGDQGVVGVYIGAPGAPQASAFTRPSLDKEAKTLVGFGAARLVEVNLADGSTQVYLPNADGGWDLAPETPIAAGLGDAVLEVAIPLDSLPPLKAGDTLNLRVLVAEGEREAQLVPAAGPVAAPVPDLSNIQPVLEVIDPTGDDHGPGAYVYPTDAVFEAGVFDLERFLVGIDQDNQELAARFDVAGPVKNPWGAGNGLSPQTFDFYLDIDPGADTGCKGLYKGRNASLAPGFGWEFMFTAEGWEYGMFTCGADGQPAKATGDMRVIVADAAGGVVDVRLPLASLPAGFDPAKSAYLGLALSQEGASGDANKRGRVRDIAPTAEQWLFGGAPDDSNHTRIIDAALPAGVSPSQEEGLSDYTPSQEDFSTLPPEAFGKLPMVDGQSITVSQQRSQKRLVIAATRRS